MHWFITSNNRFLLHYKVYKIWKIVIPCLYTLRFTFCVPSEWYAVRLVHTDNLEYAYKERNLLNFHVDMTALPLDFLIYAKFVLSNLFLQHLKYEMRPTNTEELSGTCKKLLVKKWLRSQGQRCLLICVHNTWPAIIYVWWTEPLDCICVITYYLY